MRTLTTTERKKMRRADKLARMRAHADAHFDARFDNVPTPVKPRLTVSDAHDVQVGDTVIIARGRISRSENVLYSGAQGRVIRLWREHDHTMAAVQLKKKNAAGMWISVRKHTGELQVIDPRTGKPMQRVDPSTRLPEHAEPYPHSTWGRLKNSGGPHAFGRHV